MVALSFPLPDGTQHSPNPVTVVALILRCPCRDGCKRRRRQRRPLRPDAEPRHLERRLGSVLRRVVQAHDKVPFDRSRSAVPPLISTNGAGPSNHRTFAQTRGSGPRIRANAPIFYVIVVQIVFLGLAWRGTIILAAAYVASNVYTLVALFGLGVYAGRVASFKWPISILSGVEAATIGSIIVVLETLLD